MFTLWRWDVGKAKILFIGWGNALCRWQKQTLVPVHALAAGILSFVSLTGLASFYLTARLLLNFLANKWGFCSCPSFMQPLQVIFVPELRARLLKNHWHKTQPRVMYVKQTHEPSSLLLIHLHLFLRGKWSLLMLCEAAEHCQRNCTRACITNIWVP